MIASALGGNLYAQFDGAKTYVISNRNDANLFMLDNSTGGIALGAKTSTVYWKLIATSNADCYYVQNAATGKYMQSCNASEVEVAMGDDPVEYCILDCSAGEGVGMYGMASTDQTTYDCKDISYLKTEIGNRLLMPGIASFNGGKIFY